MLVHRKFSAGRRAQSGVVLMVALIVLVAMTLAGLALVRSMDTSNLIAGNMAFQQSAVHSGDAGTEVAIAWLEANNSGSTLWGDNPPMGYFATRQDPAGTQSWDAYWTTVQVTAGVRTLTADATGNTVSYVIHRLCSGLGDPVIGVGCAVPQNDVTSTSSSKGAGIIALQYNSQVYYRITSRIVGPRNTVSLIQSIVAM